MRLSTLLILGGAGLGAYAFFGPPGTRFADAGPAADARRAEQDRQQKNLLLGAGAMTAAGLAAHFATGY